MTPAPTPTPPQPTPVSTAAGISAITPTPSTSASTNTPAGVNWDAVSAVSDAIVAFGTLVTLVFVALTVRQQGKALGLQINQLEAERDKQKADRLRSEEDARQRKINNVRRVRFSTWEMNHNPRPPLGGELLYMQSPEEFVAKKMFRQTGAKPWHATAAVVKNGSDMVVRNISFHVEGLSRPQFIWRENATNLIEGYELDQLAPGGSATFVWISLKEIFFQERNPELRFSDEDGHRWRTDLAAHTARIDDLRA